QSRGAGLALDLVGELGEEGVAHVRDQQPDGLGALGAQGAGLGVGDVVQPLRGGEHPFTGLGRDGAVAGQGAGGRAERDPGLGGDVLDGGSRHRRLLTSTLMETFPCRSVAPTTEGRCIGPGRQTGAGGRSGTPPPPPRPFSGCPVMRCTLVTWISELPRALPALRTPCSNPLCSPSSCATRCGSASSGPSSGRAVTRS